MLGIHPMTVSLYVKRYNAGGIEALVADKTRKPGKAPVSEELKNKICTTACTKNLGTRHTGAPGPSRRNSVSAITP
jgi:hypothetical protein